MVMESLIGDANMARGSFDVKPIVLRLCEGTTNMVPVYRLDHNAV
jgi:hypothetical protein